MQLNPDELVAHGYVLIDELKHDELIPFVKKYLNQKTKITILYYFLNVLFFGILVMSFLWDRNTDDYDLSERFLFFSYGMALSFLLTPVHEYIHILSYRYLGAKSTTFKAVLKKFMFLALAHNFVANRREFQLVALAPFVTITVLLFILLFFANGNYATLIISTIFAHSAMCSGDFGLLSYFEFHKNKNIVTFDDVENQISYFYAK